LVLIYYIAQEEVDPRYWSTRAKVFFNEVKNDIDKSVSFVGRGRTRRLNGTFPRKYAGLVSPSADILSYYSKKPVLDMEDFCLPDFFVWWPEYPSMYPDGVPNCKWCKKPSCVMHDGWMRFPRRGHSRTRNVECCNSWKEILLRG
jgi:hypothetical protein